MRGNPEEVEGLPIPPGAGSHPQYIELSRGTPGNAPGKPGVPKPPKPPKPPVPPENLPGEKPTDTPKPKPEPVE